MSNVIKRHQTSSNVIRHHQTSSNASLQLHFYTLIFPGGLHLESVFLKNFSIISFPFLFITKYFGIPDEANIL